MAAGIADPAIAQLSGSATIASQSRLRGRPISDGDPTLSAAAAYDDGRGWYVDMSAIAGLRLDSAPHLTALAADVGYAWRDATGRSFDAGITRQQFTPYASRLKASGYSEVYAGISGHSLAARIAYSPDYFSPGTHTLYASLDGVLRPAASWRIGAHAGALGYLSAIPVGPRLNYDAAISLTKIFGRVEAGVSVSTGGPGRDRIAGPNPARTALVGSATITF